MPPPVCEGALVSVIVPIYNTQKFLSRCIDSVLAQTYKNFELILVDDGSSDESPALCDQYKTRDSRIKVIHKKNGGVSSARNAGLDAAAGKYICFIDSDDYVEENYIEILYDEAEKTGADLVVAGFVAEEVENPFSKETKIKKTEHNLVPTEKEKIFYTQKEFFDCFVVLRTNKNASITLDACWSRLYRLTENGLPVFSETQKCGEDYLFNLQFYQKMRSICFLCTSPYHYCLNPNSATRVLQKKNLEDDIFMMDIAKDFMKKNCPKNQMKYHYIRIRAQLFGYSFMVLKERFLGGDDDFVEKMKVIQKKINARVIFTDFFVLKHTIFLLLCKLHFYRAMEVMLKIFKQLKGF